MCDDGPEDLDDLSWIEFDYRGVTGLGRRRTVNGAGEVIEPPKPWHQILSGRPQ